MPVTECPSCGGSLQSHHIDEIRGKERLLHPFRPQLDPTEFDYDGVLSQVKERDADE